MRRYPLLLILLLSFIMPLQVAADILLSASPCPEEMTMVVDETGTGEPMPCCPDADDTDSVSPCETAQSCHLCKTPVQLYLHTPAIFASLSDLSAHAKPPRLIVVVFNPAGIWRPPNLT